MYICALCGARSGARIKFVAKIVKKNDIRKSGRHFFTKKCNFSTKNPPVGRLKAYRHKNNRRDCQ